jgi:PKD repeat protein
LHIEKQPAHTVILIKIMDASVAAQPPVVNAKVPGHGRVSEDLDFAAGASEGEVPALAYHWNFGDGVRTDGRVVRHAYTHPGTFRAELRVEGVDGVPLEKTYTVMVSGSTPVPTPERMITAGEQAAESE